ncbi:hypothetical protein V496_10434 [Pseudogymnoascus sp. VKM F-4515 (FW-2607)]|nr:hypothetical protein V496_10434 [Pseudogymnoascus sp. VKM F-4515 (FW-2607)]
MSLYDGVVFSAPPPEGVIPDANAPHNATALVVCIGVFLPLAIISTAIRIFTRVQVQGSVAIDDYMMLGALACSIALSASIIDMLRWGLGSHLWNVPLEDLYGMPHFLYMNLIAAIIFCAATGMAKTSILLFYRRIFPSKAFHYAVWGLVAFTVGYSAASVFVNIFSCNPVQATWEVEFATAVGICINRPVFYFAQAGFGILTDFATVIAPLPVMWRLQLGLKQKLGVAGILTTGGFVCIISIIRLYSISVLLRSTDLTYDTPPALMWCVIELNMSIVGGCIATFKPFLRKYFPRVLGSSRSPAMVYGSNTGASRSRKRGQSYQLESTGQSDSFNRVASNKKGFVSTTINAADTKYNSSEECIVIPGDSADGQIIRTVQFETSYEESKDTGKVL